METTRNEGIDLTGKTVFISLPRASSSEPELRERAKELVARVEALHGRAVNPYDITDRTNAEFKAKGARPKFKDYASACFGEVIQCDGLLVDVGSKHSYICGLELALAQAMASGRHKEFYIFHTRELWGDVKGKYVI